MPRTFGYVFLLCGAAVISMCLYYDHERHKDPNFKKRLREKRNKLQKEHLPFYEISPASIDPQFREAMIINEIQVAEKLMMLEKWEEAIVHFAHAISVCADPGHLLNCLKQTLPAQSYDMLLLILTNMYDGKFANNNYARQGLTLQAS